jgi:prepilin-type N-terminal cleavage/methylation domain-containing protein
MLDNRFNRRCSNRGFTLLEVMLAVFVFSLTITSLFMMLNSSSRTFVKTTARVDSMLRARGAMDVITRDFRSMLFLDESSYNVTAEAIADDIMNAARQIQLGDIDADDEERDENRRRGGSRYVDRDRDDDDDSDPFLLPPEIDLAFIGQDGGDIDEISFVTYQPTRVVGYRMPWGMRRVHYYVRDNTLYRTEDNVFKEQIDQDGNMVSKPDPVPEKIADGVKYFDLMYFYWEEGDWLGVPSWDSNERTRRFPYEAEELEEEGLNYQQAREFLDDLPDDNLPSLVRIEIGLSHGRTGGLVRPFRKSFRLFQAQETGFPLENILGEQRDRRRRERVRRAELEEQRRGRDEERGSDRRRNRR